MGSAGQRKEARSVELARPRLLLPVLELHFSELDLLWERRENCIYDEVWNLEDLADLERRWLAHLEGLHVGQGHAADLAYAALEGDETGTATAAAFVLLGLGRVALAELVERLPDVDEAVAHGIRIALRHVPHPDVDQTLRPLTSSESAVVRACATDVLAFHRMAPVPDVRGQLEAEDPGLRELAMAALGRWRTAWEADDLRAELDPAKSAAEQRVALETSARLGLTELVAICREAATRESEPIPEALSFLGVVGEAADLALFEQALGDPALSGAALRGLGALGQPAGVERILTALEDPGTAHDAAAAFQRITGATDLSAEQPLEPPPDLPEEDVDFWDDSLDVDPELGRAWWKENGSRFEEGKRWQSGLEVADAGFVGTVHELTLEARRDAYLRSRCRLAAETPDVELEASALAQQKVAGSA
jgi:uncharacterized protein (TIGR02270 family)